MQPDDAREWQDEAQRIVAHWTDEARLRPLVAHDAADLVNRIAAALRDAFDKGVRNRQDA